MSDRFAALQIHKTDDGVRSELTELSLDDLMDGDVTVRVERSTVNYKDGLAVTGKAPIARISPLIPGIDLAGVVTASGHAGFSVGDRVVLNGFGVGEKHHGGYAGMARLNGDWLLKLPDGLSTSEAMAIGTAGYTAALCARALQRHGLTPDSGDVLVTGASGGVGGVAVGLLSALGFTVVAATGRPSEEPYLKSLGASRILDRAELAGDVRPLSKQLWAGCVDVAGGKTLANVLSQLKYGGAVAACGLADSPKLPAMVAPFILRGVSLLGIDSVYAPMAARVDAYAMLDAHLDRERLASMTTEIPLAEVPAAAEAILAGKVRGRTLVRLDS